MGTQQSGVPDLKVADLVRDRPLLTSVIGRGGSGWRPQPDATGPPSAS